MQDTLTNNDNINIKTRQDDLVLEPDRDGKWQNTEEMNRKIDLR